MASRRDRSCSSAPTRYSKYYDVSTPQGSTYDSESRNQAEVDEVKSGCTLPTDNPHAPALILGPDEEDPDADTDITKADVNRRDTSTRVEEKRRQRKKIACVSCQKYELIFL